MINDETLQNIEKLHKLKSDGVISEEDFANAKNHLLQSKQRMKYATLHPSNELEIPAEDDWIGWMMLPFKQYAEFNGRSRRKE